MKEELKHTFRSNRSRKLVEEGVAEESQAAAGAACIDSRSLNRYFGLGFSRLRIRTGHGEEDSLG
jgi:hypothetical protein